MAPFVQPVPGVLGSILRIFPSRLARFWAVLFGSPEPPPSPTAAYRQPSGPNASIPPLWFAKVGWGMETKMTREFWSATLGFGADAPNRSMVMAPFASVNTGGVAVSKRLAFGLDPASPTLIE